LGQELGPFDLPASEAEWRSVLRLASRHLVTLFLRWAFQEQGLTSGLPPDVQEFLDAVYALNLDSNLHTEDQLAHLIRELNQIGVRPLLLKGAATLVSGLYPTPGERMIGDIDVLIPPSKLAEVVGHLRLVGYQPAEEEKELLDPENLTFHHYPRLYSHNWPAPVELHVRPVHRSVAQVLGGEELFRDATLSNWREGRCFLPSPTHFMLHNVTHAFLMDYRRGFLSIRQLFEFVYACRTWAERIDWELIEERLDTLGYGGDLRSYVALANAYFGFRMPSTLTRSRGNPLRRRLYRLQLEHPATLFLFSLVRLVQILGSILRTRAHALVNTPQPIKELLRFRNYMWVYRELKGVFRWVNR